MPREKAAAEEESVREGRRAGRARSRRASRRGALERRGVCLFWKPSGFTSLDGSGFWAGLRRDGGGRMSREWITSTPRPPPMATIVAAWWLLSSVCFFRVFGAGINGADWGGGST